METGLAVVEIPAAHCNPVSFSIFDPDRWSLINRGISREKSCDDLGSEVWTRTAGMAALRSITPCAQVVHPDGDIGVICATKTNTFGF